MKVMFIQGCNECNYYDKFNNHCRELNKKLDHCFENFDEECPFEDMSFKYYTAEELMGGSIVCPHCIGTGRILVAGILKDEGGYLSGIESQICSVCNGKGRVVIRLEEK